MIVTVPASSANLGPGFDSLGMALTLHARFGTSGDGLPGGAHVVDRHHPARVAFNRLGGRGDVYVHHAIPSGRGLGFSGAMRVGGAALASAMRGPEGVVDRAEVFAVSAELEGHSDNVAASVFGGVVATAGGRVVRVPVALHTAVVVWVPTFETATDRSRRQLSPSVAFSDAVFNVGRTALLVAALAAGDVDVLRAATQDRLHQDVRLEAAPPSRVALDALVEAGAWCAWLSGSGPTVAALCAPADAEAIAAALPVAGGRASVLELDDAGVTLGSTAGSTSEASS
jgi:homoserine kinase